MVSVWMFGFSILIYSICSSLWRQNCHNDSNYLSDNRFLGILLLPAYSVWPSFLVFYTWKFVITSNCITWEILTSRVPFSLFFQFTCLYTLDTVILWLWHLWSIASSAFPVINPFLSSDSSVLKMSPWPVMIAALQTPWILFPVSFSNVLVESNSLTPCLASSYATSSVLLGKNHTVVVTGL